MPKRDKKQRHKAKREAKRHAAKRRDSVSPVKRLAEAPGEIECWMSDDFESSGQAQLFVYKRAAGLTGLASFLVDRGVVGLKDAWTRIDLDRNEFGDMLDSSERNGIRMRRVTLDEVRRWVAGGVRWAHENGMRLPKDWAKPASLIGGVGDWASADVSAFVMEFAGHPEDLRQRLVTEPFETYVRRTDVDFIFDDEAPFKDQGTGMYSNAGDPFDLDEDERESIVDDIPEEELNRMVEQLTPAATALAAETVAWMTPRGDAPSPALTEAWRTVMLAAMLSKTAMPDAPEEDVADFGYTLIRELSERIDDAGFDEHHRAVGQVLDHLQTDSMMMKKAVLTHGLANERDDQPDDR